MLPVVFPTTVPVRIDDSPIAYISGVASVLAVVLTGVLAAFTFNLARRTKIMAQATEALATETGNSIKQTGQAMKAEERQHRQSLQPHLTFYPKRVDKDGHFDGYTLHVENIGPGYACKVEVRGRPVRLPRDAAHGSAASSNAIGEAPGTQRLGRAPGTQLQVVDPQAQTTVWRTRLHDTRPNGLKSGGSWEVGIIDGNEWGFIGLEATYQDAFSQQFRSYVKGTYDTSSVTEFEQLTTTEFEQLTTSP
jgi:hypothetical protein